MTEPLSVTQVGDSWTNESKPGENYGSATWVQLYSGVRRGWLLPRLPVIAGRTVVDAYLVGHSGGTAAQTLTFYPPTARWSPGRIKGSNQPGVNTSASFTASLPALADGEAFEVHAAGLTSLLQSVADGDDWFGLRASTNVTSMQKFYSSESGQPAWELVIVLSELVDQPTDLRPDGGAVQSASPVLAWGSTDIGGDAGQQVSSRVQVDTPTGSADPDGVAPDYDSGWVANLAQQWSLVGRRTLVGAGPHFFRVRTRDADNTESDWSDWAEFTVAAMPTLIRDSPVGAFGDITPLISAHLSSGSVRQWKAMVTGPDRATVRAEIGTQTGPISWQVPAKSGGVAVLREDKAAECYLQVWPEGDWVAAPGSLPYREMWFPLQFNENLGVQAPTGLSVTPLAPGDPRMEWSWRRTEDADAWLLQADDVTIVRLDADDVMASGGYYTWRDRGEVAPMRPRNLSVRAIEGQDRSRPAVLPSHVHNVDGVVLLLDDDSEPIFIKGKEVAGFVRNDFRSTYVTAEGEEIDITYGMPGRTIPFEGTIDSYGKQDVWQLIDRIEAAKVSRTRMARVVWGSQTAYGRLRDPDATSHPDIKPSNLKHLVRFNLYQTGP